MISELGGDSTEAFWVGTGYFLPNAVNIPFIASVSDIFGRPICLMASVGLFAIGSIVCCVSRTIVALLVGRVVQGIGGGGCLVLSLVIFTDIVPLRYRPKHYGTTVLAAWALGTIIGPLLGGAFVSITWRWVFYIMLPFAGIALVAIPFLLTLKPRAATVGEKLARVDWLGAALFIPSATLVLVGISRGGTQVSWGATSSIVTLVVGAAGLVATFVWEYFFAIEPFLRRSLFRRTSSVATYFCGVVQGLLLFGCVYYVIEYHMGVRGCTPIQAGVNMLPALCFTVPSAVITGLFVTRTKNYRYPIWIGWVLVTLATGLLIRLDENTTTAEWVIDEILVGLGHGMVLNAQNFATQAMADAGDEGASAAMYLFMRQLGSALGVGIGASVFQNVMAIKLSWLGLPSSLVGTVENIISTGGDATGLPSSSGGSPSLDGLLAAVCYGLRGTFAVYCGAAGLALLVSLLMKHYDMDKEIDSEHQLHENRLSRAMEGKKSSVTVTVRSTDVDSGGSEADEKRRSTLDKE
jgi:hypothetical protein